MFSELIILNEARNVTLTAYIQPVEGEFPNIPKRPAVLILPGGAYQYCSSREADPVAMPYLKSGYHVFILRYSVGENAVWPNPLDDYEQAMELIKTNANIWHVYTDKVAVVGFSAGGHLAGAAAALSKNRPAAAVLGYPAVSGETIHMCLPSAPDIPAAVNRDTCPCFVFTARDDNVVPVRNTIALTAALDRHGVAFESHVYAYGPHGYSTGDASVLAPGTSICGRAGRWVEDSIAWLKDMMGDFGAGSMTEPRCPRRVNDDGGEFLSDNCTLGYLMEYEAAKTVIGPVLESIKEQQSDSGADILMFARTMKLSDVMKIANLPAGTADAVAAGLRDIPAVTLK